PAIGWPTPVNRFWIAIDSANTSRPKPSSWLIGWRKNPKVERGPKVKIEIRQPHTRMTAGVRQPRLGCGAGVAVAIVPPYAPAADVRRRRARPAARASPRSAD